MIPEKRADLIPGVSVIVGVFQLDYWVWLKYLSYYI